MQKVFSVSLFVVERPLSSERGSLYEQLPETRNPCGRFFEDWAWRALLITTWTLFVIPS